MILRDVFSFKFIASSSSISRFFSFFLFLLHICLLSHLSIYSLSPTTYFFQLSLDAAVAVHLCRKPEAISRFCCLKVSDTCTSSVCVLYYVFGSCLDLDDMNYSVGFFLICRPTQIFSLHCLQTKARSNKLTQ